ncbi:MAG: sodium/proline symporter [Acidobacteria bacterium]|nr:MAG: sodium/proline symporter [Acidobacteriota bacterium]
MAPAFGRPLVVAAAGLYGLAVLAVGLWAGRRTRTARDFFIAGQDLGLWVTAAATMSAAFSGFVFLGGPGLTYRIGLGSLFICLPVGFTSAMLCWTVGRRLRELAGAAPVLTVPDVILQRYGSRTASGLAALAVVVGVCGYLGAQILALGIVVEAVFGTRASLGEWSLPVAMAAGTIVVLAYTSAGGMVAAAYTDLLQGALMVAAAVGVFGVAIAEGGGLPAMAASISSRFGSRFLEPFGQAPVTTALGFWFVFSVGTLGQPHLLHKFFMLRDPAKLRWLPVAVTSGQALCLAIWFGLGLAVPALVAQGRLPPLDRPDEATLAFLLRIAPDGVVGLALAGVLAAIMSTVDSFVNVGAAAIVRDLPRALGRPLRRELLWGRIATGALLVGAAVLAWLHADLIALLGTFAFGTFAAALAPALAVGLNWPGVTARAASLSIGTGLVLNVALEFLQRQPFFPGLPRPPLAAGAVPSAVALAASFLVLLAASWIRPRGEEAADRTAPRLPEAPPPFRDPAPRPRGRPGIRPSRGAGARGCRDRGPGSSGSGG